jgi:hypothetical protein
MRRSEYNRIVSRARRLPGQDSAAPGLACEANEKDSPSQLQRLSKYQP